MHLYFIVRGIRQQVEIFEKFMQTQMFPWIRTNLDTGEDEMIMFQGGYRDCGMFKEFVFPEECLEDVLRMLKIDPNRKDYAISRARMALLRKALGHRVHKIPKNVKAPKDYPMCAVIEKKGEKVNYFPYRFVEMRGISLHVVGIKKDKRGEIEEYTGTKYYQELL